MNYQSLYFYLLYTNKAFTNEITLHFPQLQFSSMLKNIYMLIFFILVSIKKLIFAQVLWRYAPKTFFPTQQRNIFLTHLESLFNI